MTALYIDQDPGVTLVYPYMRELNFDGLFFTFHLLVSFQILTMAPGMQRQ